MLTGVSAMREKKNNILEKNCVLILLFLSCDIRLIRNHANFRNLFEVNFKEIRVLKEK